MVRRNESLNVIIVFVYGAYKSNGFAHSVAVDSIDTFNSMMQGVEIHNNMRIIYQLSQPTTIEEVKGLLYQLVKKISDLGQGCVDYQSITRPGVPPNSTTHSYHTIFDQNNNIVQDAFLLQM